MLDRVQDPEDDGWPASDDWCPIFLRFAEAPPTPFLPFTIKWNFNFEFLVHISYFNNP